MSKSFAEALKELRGTRKKADFARFLGVSAPVYQRYEEGRVPRADVLSVISRRLNVTVEQLLAGDVHPATPDPFPPSGLSLRDAPADQSMCRYPADCDLPARLKAMEDDCQSMRADVIYMRTQLETLTRLLGATLIEHSDHVAGKTHKRAG